MSGGLALRSTLLSDSRSATLGVRHLATLLVMAVAAIIAFAVGLGTGNAQQAYAATQEQDLAAAGAPQVSAQDLEFLYNNGDENIQMSGKVSGEIMFDEYSMTIRLDNVKANKGLLRINLDGRYVLLELKGENENVSISSNVPVKIKGSGTLTGNVSTSETSDLFVTNGTIKGEVSVGRSFTMAGGKIVGRLETYNGFVDISSGTIQGSIATNGVLRMTGGTITGTNDGQPWTVYCRGLDMQKGTISIKTPQTGIKVAETKGQSNNLKISGGTISIVGPSSLGVLIEGGNLVMTGGTLAVTGAKQSAVWVANDTDNSKKYGGKVKITGGAFKATVKEPQNYYFAVYASSMTNKIDCLKSVVGCLPVGAQFAVGNNQYKITGSSSVKLVKFGKNVKKATINEVSYGKRSYSILSIGAGAFNTAAGHKLTTIIFAINTDEIGANAFANTKALTTLRFNDPSWIQLVMSANGKPKKVKVSSGSTISTKAFAKCGKKKGKGLTVSIGKTGVYHTLAGKFKKFLIGRGLPRAAKLKTF